jgi:hypothetical protein
MLGNGFALCCTTYRITRKHPSVGQGTKDFYHQKVFNHD